MAIGSQASTKIRLEFKRVIRNCRYNEDLQSQHKESAAAPRLLYDFNVIIEGEHRAILVKESHGYQGYTVYDGDHEPIVGASLTSGRTITRAGRQVEAIPNQKGFEARINLLLEEGKIPTMAALAAKAKETAAHVRNLEAAAIERERVGRIQAAGVDLYEALKRARQMCAEAFPKFNWAKSALDANAIALLNEVPGEIERAIIKAEGGAS